MRAERFRSRGLLAAGLLGGLLLLPPAPGSGGERGANPHAFMADTGGCTSCHGETPDPERDDHTTVTFKDQIVALCVGCHAGAHYRDEHPLEINPDSEVPQELHLDSYYTITCATCHDPHGEHESDRRYVPADFAELAGSLLSRRESFPTYFLRMPNDEGQLCLSCHRRGVGSGEALEFSADTLPQYVGSATCRECHPGIYEEWSRSLHATNFEDARENPAAVKARFDGDDPFPPGTILYAVGSHWTQRYVVESKRGLAVRPEQWSITSQEWMKGGGSFSRPWLKYCAGCHTTALNPFDGSYLERGTGCEGCHGPGLRHSETTDQYDIVNPTILVESRRDMICEACHTSGHDRSGGFRFPVGFRPGEDLTRYYRGLVPKTGQDAESFTGDGSYEDRHRQYEFWASRINIMKGLSCDICTAHNRPPPGEVQEETEYALSPNEMCGTCHRSVMKNYEGHSGHGEEQAGCLDCHPPAVTAAGDAFSIHDHKFRFGVPPKWMVEKTDPCLRCHPGMNPDERAAAL